jgi:multiple sugar transport system substrate-binding protein
MSLHSKILRVGCCLLVATLLACHSPDSTQTEIVFWAMGAEGEAIGQLLPEFNRIHPEISVKVQAVPWSAAHEKLLTAFAGQSTPDLCQLGNTWLPEFQAIGAILPLDSLLHRSNQIHEKHYFPGIWQTNVLNDQIYGIPWYVDTRLLFYRSDIFLAAGAAQPPETWAEWKALAQKIAGADSRKAVLFPIGANEWQIPTILILQNNGRLLKEKACYGAFDDPNTMEALRFYLSFFAEDLAVLKMTEVSNIFQAFGDGVFSMMITGPWMVHSIRTRLPDLSANWRTAPLPGQANRASVAGGSSLVIFKNSRHPAAAWEFIEFLAEKNTQIKFFELTRDLPAVKAAWNAAAIQSDREIQAFYAQLEHAVPTPKIAEWEQIAVKIQQHLEEVIHHQKTLDEAVRALNREVDQILEKRRWLLDRGLIR